MLVLKKSKSGQVLQIKLREPLSSTDSNIYIKIDNFENVNLIDDTLAGSSDVWTTSATAGRTTGNPKEISVTDTTDLLPGQYFITSTTGHYEKINVVSIESLVKVILANGLAHTYNSGSEIIPANETYTIPDAVVTEECQFVANISYYNKNEKLIAYNEDGYVHTNPAGCPVDKEMIFAIWPNLQSMQATLTFNTDIDNKLESVWNGIRSKLLSFGLMPEHFKNVDVLKQICIYELAYTLAMGGIDARGVNQPGEFEKSTQSICERKWNEFFSTKQFIDKDETGSKPTTETAMIGRRIEY